MKLGQSAIFSIAFDGSSELFLTTYCYRYSRLRVMDSIAVLASSLVGSDFLITDAIFVLRLRSLSNAVIKRRSWRPQKHIFQYY
jgi:hypothetical protein